MSNMGMRLMDHPASSPDLNLAENPIGQIKYNIMNRKERRPTNLAQLRVALEFEWNAYSQIKLAYLVERFPRRLQAESREWRPISLPLPIRPAVSHLITVFSLIAASLS
jgi:hypothetical protein